MTGSAAHTDTPPGPVPADQMRQVLGQFASGVVVVTANGPGGPVGFTCQSFSSLSLDPPLVSFSPARTSTSWPKIRDIGTFCVNVLAEDHEHHSDGFARSGVDKFAGVEWEPSPHGTPVLPGVSAWIDCTLWAEYDGGDHTIVAAHVLDLGAEAARVPLLFHQGSYGLTRAEARDISEDR